MMNDDKKKKAMMVLEFGKSSKPNKELDETEQPGAGTKLEELAGNVLLAVKNGNKKELASAIKEMIYNCMSESDDGGEDLEEYPSA